MDCQSVETKANTMTPAEVRALRAQVYGECSDNNWLACEAKWLLPENILWLQEAVKRNHLIKP